MSRANVIPLSSNKVKILVPADAAEGIAIRMCNIESALLCIAAAGESGDDVAKLHAPGATRLVAEAISQLSNDLDVAAWRKLGS